MISLTSPIETPYHKISAGIKFLLLFLATTVLYYVSDVWIQLICLLFIWCLYMIAGIKFLVAGLKQIYILWPFLLVIGAWHMYSNSIILGSIIALRLLSVVALANLITMTSRLQEIIDVMSWSLTPFRKLGLNTRGFEISIALVIRFVPILSNKGSCLLEAWRSRTTKRAGWRIITPFALIALDDAEHVSDALRARGGIQNNQNRKNYGT